MLDVETVNFFKDPQVQADPYPYFDALRDRGPVWQEPKYGVFMVTGHEEATSVYNDSAHFSSCNVVSGPFMPFPEPFEGDDVLSVILSKALLLADDRSITDRTITRQIAGT